MKKVIYVIIILLITGLVYAQYKLGEIAQVAWDHDGLNTTGYAIIVDGVRTDLQMTPVCSGTPRTCLVSAPSTINTVGSHTIVVEAYNTNGKTESEPLSITVFVLPSVPSNLKVIRK